MPSRSSRYLRRTTLGGGEKLLILGLDTSSELKLYEDSFDQGNVSIKNPLAFASREDSIAVTRAFAETLWPKGRR